MPGREKGEFRGLSGTFEPTWPIFDVNAANFPRISDKSVSAKTLRPILREHIARDAHLMTDEAAQYVLSKPPISEDFASHSFVRHSRGEYVKGNTHTNTLESYFSVLKRGLVGTFHHVSAQHLSRYCGEFDFRYNHRKLTDRERADMALTGITGKRLMYRDTSV